MQIVFRLNFQLIFSEVRSRHKRGQLWFCLPQFCHQSVYVAGWISCHEKCSRMNIFCEQKYFYNSVTAPEKAFHHKRIFWCNAFLQQKALYAVTKKCKLVKRIFQLRIFLFDSGIICFKEYQAFHFELKLTIYTNMAVFMNVICSDKYIFMNHCELDNG